MNRRYLGDALDHWKGSLFEYLQNENVLRNFAVDPMATDAPEWNKEDSKLFAHLLRIKESQLVRHSLHASGRWRMGYTSAAIEKNSKILAGHPNRAWEVWDTPPATLPGVVTAFHLIFPSSELAVRPEQRPAEKWKNVTYLEPAPQGQMLLVTLFITLGDPVLEPSHGPSVRLASLAINDGRCAPLVACSSPEANIPNIIERCTSEARAKAQSKHVELPPESYGYFLGRQDDGARYLFGARVFRTWQPTLD